MIQEEVACKNRMACLMLIGPREFVEGKEGRRFRDDKTLGADYNKRNLSF